VSHLIEHGGRVFGLGRHVEHDPRSLQFEAARATTLRTVLHEHHGPVLDQGQLGSCTGNAIAQACNTDPLIKPGRRLLTEDDAINAYERATRLDGYPGVYPPDDTGSSGLAAAKAARALGWIGHYRHAFGLQHLLEALVLQPVIIGISWTRDMFAPDLDGYVHPSGDPVGGHEVCLIGLDVDRRDVVVLNSWSENWGLGGTARMSWVDLDDRLRNQGDCTVPVL
jgi:hypothetical protein